MERMSENFRDKYLGGFPDESIALSDWYGKGVKFDYDKFANWYFATILKVYKTIYQAIRKKIFPKGFMWKVDLLVYAKNILSGLLTFYTAKFVFDRYNTSFWIFLLFFIFMANKTIGETKKKTEENQVLIMEIYSKLSER